MNFLQVIGRYNPSTRGSNHRIQNRLIYYRNVVNVNHGSRYRNVFIRSRTRLVNGHRKQTVAFWFKTKDIENNEVN